MMLRQYQAIREETRRFGVFFAFLVVVMAVPSEAANKFHVIDLAPFYAHAEGPSVFSGLAGGTQTFDSVPFTLSGAIQITGMDAARRGEFWPAEVRNVPVNLKAQRLHLLVGAHHGQRDGVPLANIVLHFKNGETRALRLAFGVHTRNAVGERGGQRESLADPNSRMVWETNANDSAVRLHKTVFDNPLPGEEITSFDFVSLFGRATPVLFAVTAETEATAPLKAASKTKVLQRATEFPDSAYRREMEVRVTGTGGVTLSNAVAMLSLRDDAKTFFFGQCRANVSGKIVVAYPPQEAVSLSMRVSHPGYAVGTATFSALDGKSWPDATEVRLQRGVSIGGTVMNTSDEPVSNAMVIPHEVIQTGADQFTRIDADVATTAPNGKWIANVLPEVLPKLTFEVTHPEHHTETLQLTAAELQSTNARIVLRPFVQVAGRVTNKDGAPVSRATVTLMESDTSRETRTTDGSGRFAFIIREPGNVPATLFVVAPNYAPLARSVTPDAAATPDLKLETGSTFSMRVSDGNGAPLTGLLVSLYRWDGKLQPPLRWSTKTDAQGRFRWEHAPAGQVTFRIEKPGQLIHYEYVTLPMTNEALATYRAPVRIVGKVIDAQTKKPVDQLRVRTRYSSQGSSSSSSTTGKRGSFNLTLSSLNSTNYNEFTLTIEAAGYTPFVTNRPPPGGTSTNVYEMHRAKMIEGTVLTPDGKPAARAELVLLDPGTSAYMDEPGKFRRNSYSFDAVPADDAGHFVLTPKADADFLLAAHPKFGYLQMPASDFKNGGTIKLERWGHVKGVLRVGDKLEPYQKVAIHSRYNSQGNRNLSPLNIYYVITPASDGSFHVDRVPPGDRTVQLRYMFGPKETGNMRLSHNVPITVKPGETNDVLIGGEGRTLVGKVNLIGGPGLAIDGARGTFNLNLIPGSLPSEIPPPLSFPPKMLPGERDRLLKEHQQKMIEWSRARAAASRMTQRNYFVLFDDNNSFTVPTVPPGRYALHLQPYDSRAAINTTRTLGTMQTNVVVPAGKGTFDLGTFEIKVRP
jgi:hypothetical protein